MNEQRHLQLQNINLAFNPGAPLLEDINLALKPGSVTGLLGRNGAGKTTLLRIALGLLKPDGGQASLFGESAWSASAKTRRRIGYVAQDDTPFSWMRVSDSLNLVGSFYADWDAAMVDRYIDEWELDRRARILNLSSGQRQKVAILMAMGHRPDLLVLDEPVASLDPGARRQFLQALVELNQELDRTILFSTHITSDLERVAADVAILRRGSLAYQGELDNLTENYQRLFLHGDSLPAVLKETDVSNYQCSGDRATAFGRNWHGERSAALAAKLGASVRAESLPLEELFLELTHD